MIPPMVVRGQAAQACIDRFAGRVLNWRSVDCGRIAGHNLRQLGIGTPLLKGARYASEAGALKHLRALGFKGLGEAVDALGLMRIPPAAATTADLIGFVCDSELWDMALTVSVGNGRVLGAHTDGIVQVLQPDLTGAVAAWRCNPCRR